jgi:hypothetical protein
MRCLIFLMYMSWCSISNRDLLRLLKFNRLWNLLRSKRRRSLKFSHFISAIVLRLNLETRSFFDLKHGGLPLTTLPRSCKSPSWIFTHPLMSFPTCIFFILYLRDLNHPFPQWRWNHLLWLWCRLRRKFDNHDNCHLPRNLVVPLPCPTVSPVLH